MNILSWNCQGLGNPGTTNALQGLIRTEKPSIVFLTETHCSRAIMDRVRFKTGMRQSIVVDSVGASGGLCLLWNEEVEIQMRSASLNHIDVDVKWVGGHDWWRLTGFYGFPVTADRYKSWDLMRRLANINSTPWVCIGDFNEILCADEKLGGPPRCERQMRGFREAVDDCMLKDLGYSGPPFTWWRNCANEVRVRLDRALANMEWCNHFPGSKLVHLNPSKSDHLPIKLIVGEVQWYQRKRRKRFRFEEFWASNGACGDVVKEAWGLESRGSPVAAVMEKIRNTRVHLLEWSRSTFGNIGRDIEAIREKLGTLLNSSPSPLMMEQRKCLTNQLDTLYSKNELYWRQRSRAIWLKAGDCNSRFFHQKATTRKQRNHLSGLFDANGIWQNSARGVENTVLSYFHELFSSHGSHQVHDFTNAVKDRVTVDMNQSLLEDFTPLEIKEALFQMHPSKSPGPDGMSPAFFQKYWEVVGDDVVKSVLSFLQSGNISKQINFTHVVLIPKVKNPKRMQQVRPISLCNVIYKIGAKAIANRLKKILPDIISQNQSAFVPGRMISDNSIVAFETLHAMKKRRKGKKGFMALKLDMSKAYDRVEWPFLEKMMLSMGFNTHWVKLIMSCVTTVSYSFLVNGNPTGYLTPSRGLRQGDPLSPYLFLLCVEGFSAMLLQAEHQGLLMGAIISRFAPSVSHLLFADDSFVFTRARNDDCSQLKVLFQQYEAASGQMINLDKSCVSFSGNVDLDRQEELSQVLGVVRVDQHHKYLGLPAVTGRSKSANFNILKERLWNKLQGWQGNLLSFAGKEILLKVVAQAIPIYMMSCFLIPKFVCEELQQQMARYWWGQQGDKRKIHWLSWNKLCTPKSDGGLGFRHLHSFNLALLAKQVWRIFHNPESLVAQILKARYFPTESILSAPVGTNPSYVWKSLCDARVVIEHGSRWQIGDGRSVKIWGDRWLPLPHSFKVFSPPGVGASEHQVASLIDRQTMQWKEDLIQNWFSPYEAELIYRLPLSFRCPSDRLIWHFDKKGIFSVRSAYQVARRLMLMEDEMASSSTEPYGNKFWKHIWEANVPPKVRHFIWRVAQNILPTKDRLITRGVDGNLLGCVFCGKTEESTSHVLLSCPFAISLWSASPMGLCFHDGTEPSLKCLLNRVFNTCSKSLVEQIMILWWALWNERNARVWSNERHLPVEITSSAMNLLLDYHSLNFKAKPPSHRRQVRWHKPLPGTIKINVDGAYNSVTGKGGVGIVVRDNQGCFLGGRARCFVNVSSPAHVEALALLEGLAVVQTWLGIPVALESDSETLVLAVNSPNDDTSELGRFIDDARFLMARWDSCSLSHVLREGNKVAHCIARFALSTQQVCFWEQPPDFIQKDLLADLM